MAKHCIYILIAIAFLLVGGPLQANTLEKRLENIVIPEVEFEEASVRNVFDWLGNKTIK